MTELSTILKYYQIAWCDPDIEKLAELFSDDILFRYHAVDEESKNFFCQGKEQVMEFYRKWDQIANRTETKIFNFQIIPSNNNYAHTIRYEINQKHGEKWYKMQFQEEMILTKEGLILDNHFTRIYKVDL